MEFSDEDYALSCRDFTVSGKEFDLYYNRQRDMLITHPQPKPNQLPAYYQSEEYISHTDASKTLFDKLYQTVKQYMLQQKVRLINQIVEPGKLLDIGAGTGDFLNAAKKQGWRVTGVEPNTQARHLAAEKGLDLLADRNQVLDSFDCISLWHVLEHVPDLFELLQQLQTLLAKNGKLVIAVPNYKSYDAQFYKRFWAAYDVPRHLWHFSQQGIERMMKHFDFELVQTKPLVFDAYYVSLLSEKYKYGKINYLRAGYRATLSNWKARQSGEYSSLIYVFQHKNAK